MGMRKALAVLTMVVALAVAAPAQASQRSDADAVAAYNAQIRGGSWYWVRTDSSWGVNRYVYYLWWFRGSLECKLGRNVEPSITYYPNGTITYTGWGDDNVEGGPACY